MRSTRIIDSLGLPTEFEMFEPTSTNAKTARPADACRAVFAVWKLLRYLPFRGQKSGFQVVTAQITTMSRAMMRIAHSG